MAGGDVTAANTMNPLTFTWRTLLLVPALLLAGCVARPGMGEPVFQSPCLLGIAAGRQYLLGENSPAADPGQKKLEQRGADRSGLHFLALSGGGPNGTFGAGYLVGWENTRPYPDFDYVTGVSAGALLATHAFIGGDSVNRLSLLGTLEESDIVTPRVLPFSLFSDALYSTEPLKRRVIEKLLAPTALTLGAVAAKSAAGGVLRVGAVDLDNGEFVQIDLGVIAEAYVSPECSAYKNDIYNLYVDSILASAAVPLMMPPVPVGGRLLADGGIRRQLFLERAGDDTVRQPGTAVHAVPKTTEWVIVNGVRTLDLGLFDQQDQANPTLGSIGGRSVLTMIDSSLDNDLFRVCAEAERSDSVNIVSMDPLYQRYPEEWPACRSRNRGFFEGEYMHCLFALGRRLGQQGDADSCPAAAPHTGATPVSSAAREPLSRR